LGAGLAERGADERLELLVRHLFGKVLVYDSRLRLLGGRELGAPAGSIGLGGFRAPLALAFEHRDLGLLVELAPGLLRGLLECVENQP
jgi:hypothetical protein